MHQALFGSLARHEPNGKTSVVVGSPATIAKMLDFAARHDIRPVVETYEFDRVNEAIARLRSGKARYRIVLSR